MGTRCCLMDALGRGGWSHRQSRGGERGCQRRSALGRVFEGDVFPQRAPLPESQSAVVGDQFVISNSINLVFLINDKSKCHTNSLADHAIVLGSFEWNDENLGGVYLLSYSFMLMHSLNPKYKVNPTKSST